VVRGVQQAEVGAVGVIDDLPCNFFTSLQQCNNNVTTM
jgi:hypothetical protein